MDNLFRTGRSNRYKPTRKGQILSGFEPGTESDDMTTKGQVDDLVAFAAKYTATGAPVAMNAAAAIAVATLFGGLITVTQATGATIALDLPTGAALDHATTGLGMDVGDSLEWSVINLSAAAADTATITASAGHTIVGDVLARSSHSTTLMNSSSRFLTRKTAANTFVTYRIA
jgi:hypothetical protein